MSVEKGEKMSEYRKNVAAIILNQDGKIWLGERFDRMSWGFPQGGIEAGESALDAIKRELSEEIGTDEWDILATYPGLLTYDFPKSMTFPTWTYKGQEQQYFLVQLQKQAIIRLDTHPEEIEFLRYTFVSADRILKTDFGFKTDVYHTALRYFLTQEDRIK